MKPDETEDPRVSVTRRICAAQVLLIASTSCLFYYAAGNGKLGFFTFAFLAGCFGASVALLRRVQKGGITVARRVNRSWEMTLMPFLYGGLMAGITYFLFASEILSGSGGNGLLATNLFPDFALRPMAPSDAGVMTDATLEALKLQIDNLSAKVSTLTSQPAATNTPAVSTVTVGDWLRLLPQTKNDAGLLIVWSFLAGYSEGFVSGILAKLENGKTTPNSPVEAEA